MAPIATKEVTKAAIEQTRTAVNNFDDGISSLFCCSDCCSTFVSGCLRASALGVPAPLGPIRSILPTVARAFSVTWVFSSSSFVCWFIMAVLPFQGVQQLFFVQ